MNRHMLRCLSWALTVTLAGIMLLVPPHGLASTRAAVTGGQPFPIATVPGNSEENAAVAYDEGRNRYLVVNQNAGALNAVCLDATGATVASYVVGSGFFPDVTYNSAYDQYLVVFAAGSEIEGTYVSGTCCLQVGCSGAPFTISGDRPHGEYLPAVAYNRHASHQDYLVVWQDGYLGSPSHWGIWARRVTTTGVSGANPSFAISDDPTHTIVYSEPDVAYNLNMNEYLVVYTRNASTASGLDVYGRRVFNAGGGGVEPQENAIDATSKDQLEPAVAAYRLNTEAPYLVAYTDFWDDPQGDIRAYLVYTNVVPLRLVDVATVNGLEEAEPSVSSNESLAGYTVVWSQDMGNWDIYGRHVSGAGDAAGPFLVDASSQHDSRAAVAGGPPAPLAVWQIWNGNDYDVYGRFLYRRVFLPSVLR